MELIRNIDTINNIKELIFHIEKEENKEGNYRKYILRFHESWEQNKKQEVEIIEGKYIWGSRLQVPENCKIEDIFVEKTYANAVNFFREKNIVYISDLNEDILLELMFYPAIGYKGFIDVLNVLFVNEYKPEEKASISDFNSVDVSKLMGNIQEYNSQMRVDFVEEEVIDDSNSVAVIIEDESIEDLAELGNRISVDILNEKAVVELLNFNNSIKKKIEEEHAMILNIVNSYRSLLNYIKVLESKNNELNKKIQLLYAEKDRKLQLLRNKIDQIANEKNREIDSLKKELLQLQQEREEDKKVLEEFDNMIRIMGKIKGLFKKNKDFN